MWKKLAIFLFILNLALLDGVVIYQLLNVREQKEKDDDLTLPTTEKLVNTEVKEDVCGEECRNYIDIKFNEKLRLTPTTTSIITKTPVTVSAKKRNVYYVPIPGSGNTLQTDWVSIPSTDFYLDVNEYPGVIEVYLEVNMKLTNGNGYAFVRLYDSTHGIAVQGSEVKTASQTSQAVISGKIYLWAGKNLYKIQAKSLTADTTVFEGGRLKIITEN